VGVRPETNGRTTSKAVVYRGPFEFAVEDVTDPRIEEVNDAVIPFTTANIWGSDLHPDEGRADMDAAWCSATSTWEW